MRDIFIIWIIIQLAGYGAVTADIHNQIVNDEYICESEEIVEINTYEAAFIPLTLFMGLNSVGLIKEYCEDKLTPL